MGIFCFSWQPITFAQLKKIGSVEKSQADQRKETPLVITNISLDKKTFNVDKEKSVNIGYAVSKDAFVTVKLYNSEDIIVRTLVDNYKASPGSHSITWDGKSDSGEIISEGDYIYTIDASCVNGERNLYDPADETARLLLKIRKLFLDIEKRELVYIMPRAGMVRIRTGIKNGPLLKTVIDWEPREAGRQIEKWDGKVANRILAILKKNFLDNNS